MKTCTKCGEVKPLDEFYRWSDICKNCKIEYQKIYSSENSEKIKKSKKIYRSENSEKIKESQKIYRSENSEKAKEYQKIYRSENTEKVKYIEIKQNLKRQIGATPPPELVEIKVLINKTKRLCKTLKN